VRQHRGCSAQRVLGDAGSVLVVAINRGTADPIGTSGGAAPTSFTPWVTFASDDLLAKSAVAVSGSNFSATLATESVTTFVTN
jgi:glucuronoarabinoxylan endo-1,4-beta-xylanase